jgi:hypothetical protein
MTIWALELFCRVVLCFQEIVQNFKCCREDGKSLFKYLLHECLSAKFNKTIELKSAKKKLTI